MPNWNPRAPDVLGNEWLANHSHQSRVFAGAPARRQRLISTTAETIDKLRLSTTVNPLLKFDTRTLVDVCVEGNEDTALFQPVVMAPAVPTVIGTWHNPAQSQTNLHQEIDEDATAWYPGAPALNGQIETSTNQDVYESPFVVTPFAGGGSHQNGRIGFVEIRVIYGANTGFRKLWTGINVGTTHYEPAGGGLRDVHGYGATYVFWFGELNPDTQKPWTPADLAAFGTGGTSRVLIASQLAQPDHFPIVYAVELVAWAIPTENRVAVGVWKRPNNLTARLNNVETDALYTVPSGADNWAKASTTNYTFTFRQSVSPALLGAVNADDVVWNGIFQRLPADAQPPDVVYPLHTSGTVPPPASVLASDEVIHDQFGRPLDGFRADNQAAYGLALIRTDAAVSIDSQPYRVIWPEDYAEVTSAQKLGQRIVPGSSTSYLGVRFPVVPPNGDATLTVAIHRVSDSVQMGGTFTITSAVARALPVVNQWRYVSGLLSSGASLVSGTAYEIRVTTTAGGNWIMAVPDSSLGSTASFGGSTSGAFIGSTHFGDRELAINLTRQPDPPQTPTATTTDVAVTTFSEQATTVKHVLVDWSDPAVGMGASFARYEVERQLVGGAWQRIAEVRTSSVTAFTDRTVPRGVLATYRIRAIGIDGRFSNWATTSNVTVTDTRPMLILSSNDSALYFVHLYEITDSADAETVYPILSGEGDEVIAIHGADYQVVFMEHEDRGVGWRTRVSLHQQTMTTVGMARFAALRTLIRSLDVPYVCALDHQGNVILGHVSVDEGAQSQPLHRYTALLEITPTHSAPVPTVVT
jgi:hypothetical protein